MMCKSDLTSKLESNHQICIRTKLNFFPPQDINSNVKTILNVCTAHSVEKVVPVSEPGADLTTQHAAHLQWTS